MSGKRAIALYSANLCVFMFMFAVGNSTQGYMLSNFIDHYGLKSSMQGLLSSAQSFGALGALIASVFIAGKIKRPVILLAVSASEALLFFSVGQKPQFLFLVLIYVCLGLSFGFTDTSTSSIMADIHRGRASARYLGLMHGVFGFGGILSPIAMQNLQLHGVKWNGIFSILAVIALIVFIYSIITYKISSQNLDSYVRLPEKMPASDMRKFFGHSRNTLLVAGIAFYGAHQICITLWINRYVSVGLANPQLGPTSLALYWIGTVISRFLVPYLPVKPGSYLKYSMLSSAGVLLLGVYLHSAVLMCLCVVTAGLLSGAVIPMSLNVVCTWNSGNTILATTALLVFNSGGQMISPLIASLAVQAKGLQCGIILSAVACIIYALILFFIPNDKKNCTLAF